MMGIVNRILGAVRGGASGHRSAPTGQGSATTGRPAATGRGLLSALMNRRRRPM
jgi:hypothetical protein